MTTALMNLWSRSMDIATGSPEVVVRRVGGMMNPVAAWSPAGAFEMQSMLIEKMEATVEACWAMCRSAMSFGNLPAWNSTQWWLPLPHDPMTEKVVGAANLVMQPISDRVSANVERLRNHA